MRHIKDIYPLVNEVRQRIIEKMRAENIVLVQFCPVNEEEYLEEHEGEEHVENYEDFRDNHCPYVIWFDKNNSGEDCCVFSVSFIDGEHPRFKMQCEGEYDCRELFDNDVAQLTMLNVYECLERELGLDEVPDEPQKVWVLFDESLCDYELQGRRIMVFKSEDEARKKFKEFADESRKTAEDKGWEIGNDNDDFFEAYPEGSWGTSHETVELSETTFSESIWCHN